jgi:serine protease Do
VDPEAKEVSSKSSDEPAGAAPDKLGLAFRPLTGAEAQALQVRGGLVVVDIHGIEARAGRQPGDLVLSVNGEPAFSAAHCSTLICRRGVRALLVQRDEARLFIALPQG